MASPSWLDDAAAYATCATLTTTGATLVGTGVATLWAGGGGLVPLSLGMLSFLGAGALCGDTPVDGTDDPAQVNGCTQVSPGSYGEIEGRPGVTGDWAGWPNTVTPQRATAILNTRVDYVGGTTNPWSAWIEWRNTDGTVSESGEARFATQSLATRWQWRLNPVDGTCIRQPGDPTLLPPGFKDPVQYTNPTTNCTYNVSPQGFAQVSEGGQAGMVFKIEAATQTLASGGIVGGCNFEPTLVFQPPGGGPPYTGPWDPTWPDWDGGGEPPWLDFLKGAVGGAAAVAVDKILDELFEKMYPATSKSIYAACQYKEDGSPEEYTINFPEQTYQDRVLDALTAQVDFAQQFFLWKSPICQGSPQPVTGDAVSINWVSDEYSPNGNDRIRKLLTYFDQVGSTLEQTVAHWKDFTWQAGPVIVSCVGTPLGKPQVWANSEAEAKRVINHAAAIAGVDLTNATWEVAPPKSSRYGMAGKMRVHRSKNGTLGITKRDGPSGSPMGLT